MLYRIVDRDGVTLFEYANRGQAIAKYQGMYRVWWRSLTANQMLVVTEMPFCRDSDW